MQDEVFGPIFPVIEYQDLDEVINFITERPKPLALYLFTNVSACGGTGKQFDILWWRMCE